MKADVTVSLTALTRRINSMLGKKYSIQHISKARSEIGPHCGSAALKKIIREITAEMLTEAALAANGGKYHE